MSRFAFRKVFADRPFGGNISSNCGGNMKAVVYQSFGPPEVLAYVPDPTPRPGQVLVRVRAVGVNFHDNRTRLGLSTGATAPGIPGIEMAGEVVALGEGVTEVRVGDRVFGRARHSYAELVAVDVNNLFPIPAGLTFAEAAVLPVAFLTATHALFVKTTLRPGERLLVQAAGSSVGSAAVQLAKDRELVALLAGGGREPVMVIGTAGGAERCRRVREELGADAAIDYTFEDVPRRVHELTDGQGVEIVLDGVGTATFAGTLSSLATGGRALLYGASSGDDDIRLRIGDLANRGATLIGFSITAEKTLFQRTMELFRSAILPRIEAGLLRPLLDRTLPLHDAIEAHRSIIERRHFGKLALIP
jgi:NADPH:quinone reductase-like Zn-dependent oxidoreductase